MSIFNSEKSIHSKIVSSSEIIWSADGFSYIENGFLVFTEKYHLNRGYCCKNNCRHCPYGFIKK
jgi:hypothetical protein